MSDALPPSATAAAPEDAHDIRQLVAVGKGRVAWMPPAWRRCATGVTFDPPPSFRPPPRPKPAALRDMTRFETELLAELRAALGVRGGGFMPRKAIRLALFVNETPCKPHDDTIDDALASLARRKLIALDRTKGGGRRLWIDLLEEAGT